MIHGTGLRGLAVAALFLATALPAMAQTQINVIGFGAGFAWADLFGPSGTEKTQKLAGGVTVHMFLIDLKDRAYILSYNDYTPGKVDPDPQKILASVVEGNAKGVKGKVVSDEKVTIGKKKHPGRDIRIEMPDKKNIYRAKVFLVGNRLYQVVALGPDEFVKSKPVEEAMKSFAVDE